MLELPYPNCCICSTSPSKFLSIFLICFFFLVLLVCFDMFWDYFQLCAQGVTPSSCSGDYVVPGIEFGPWHIKLVLSPFKSGFGLYETLLVPSYLVFTDQNS